MFEWEDVASWLLMFREHPPWCWLELVVLNWLNGCLGPLHVFHTLCWGLFRLILAATQQEIHWISTFQSWEKQQREESLYNSPEFSNQGNIRLGSRHLVRVLLCHKSLILWLKSEPLGSEAPKSMGWGSSPLIPSLHSHLGFLPSAFSS